MGDSKKSEKNLTNKRVRTFFGQVLAKPDDSSQKGTPPPRFGMNAEKSHFL